jgi:hypothetical protein
MAGGVITGVAAPVIPALPLVLFIHRDLATWSTTREQACRSRKRGLWARRSLVVEEQQSRRALLFVGAV